MVFQKDGVFPPHLAASIFFCEELSLSLFAIIIIITINGTIIIINH